MKATFLLVCSSFVLEAQGPCRHAKKNKKKTEVRTLERCVWGGGADSVKTGRFILQTFFFLMKKTPHVLLVLEAAITRCKRSE